MVLSREREDLGWIAGREVLFRESGEVLEEAAQRCCGCPIPGGDQGQAGWGPGLPGLVLYTGVGSRACSRGVGA